MTIKAKKRNGVRSRKRTARTRKVLTGGSNYGKHGNNGWGMKSWKTKRVKSVKQAGPVNFNISTEHGVFNNPLFKKNSSTNAKPQGLDPELMNYLGNFTGTSLVGPGGKSIINRTQKQASAIEYVPSKQGFFMYKHNPNFTGTKTEPTSVVSKNVVSPGEFSLGFVRGKSASSLPSSIKYQIFNTNSKHHKNNPFNNPSAFGLIAKHIKTRSQQANSPKNNDSGYYAGNTHL